MKRLLSSLIMLFFIIISVNGQSRENISLDDAIHNSVLQMQEGLNKGATIIVYQFQSQNARMSDYILNEIFRVSLKTKNIPNFLVKNKLNKIML